MVKKPKRILKKSSPTVRERSNQYSTNAPKKQRVRNTARKITKLIRFLGKIIAKIFRPFRFILRPFKTRPVRFIGRIIAKILFIKYFVESWRELKQVTWPGRRETLQLTFAVFVFAIVFGLMITVVDYGLNKLFEKILLS